MNVRMMQWRPMALAVAVSLVGVATTACRPAASSNTPAAVTPSTVLTGRVTVDGSSTVLPMSRVTAAAFRSAHPAVAVEVNESGTGGGFQKLCDGQVDLIGASRPINAEESQRCEANRVEFVELPVAFDSVAVVVNSDNKLVECLTVPQLRNVWRPEAEGKAKWWSDIRGTLPAKPLHLFGPGKASGTFDYFTLAVVGTQSSSRSDYTKSEDDEELVRGVAADPDALGYFGYAYYLAHKDALKLVAIDNGKGCVLPSSETVADGTYQPLSRPLFVYASLPAIARPEVLALADEYVGPDNAARVREIGYVPLPTATLLSVGRRLHEGVTGSIFGNRGSVLGVTSDVFNEDDRVRSALVR